jgi:hypothetical protein
MTRWTTGILVALSTLLPVLVHAQEWSPPPPAGFNPGPGLYAQLLPDSHLFYDNDSRCDLTAREAFAGSYMRLDWINWNITGADRALLGAPVPANPVTGLPYDLTGQAALNAQIPKSPLPAVDTITTRTQTFAVVPTIGDQWENQNGLRGTLGIPTNAGTFEVEALYLAKVNNEVSQPPFQDTQIPVRTFIGATTLLLNGAPSNTSMILYSESYAARQQTSFFGTEGNWIFNPFVPNIGMTVSPILGFRYIRVNDTLHISGVDHPTSTTTLNHDISSRDLNDIFGPQIGLKFASTVGRFDFGAETKFVIGLNRVRSTVTTSQIYSATENDRSDEDSRTRFCPIFDLSLSARYHFTDHLSAYIGYDLLVGSGFYRAYDTIDYNSPTSTSNPALIGFRPNPSNFVAHGLSVGGELTFR